MKTKKAIALSGDYNYAEQIKTTIKSIAYHMQNVKIYLINCDIPQEFFAEFNRHLSQMGSSLIDLKINPEVFSNEESPQGHISQITYGRLLIPRLIPEERVLYIDSDAIVDQNLDELWSLDFAGHPLAAVHDVFLGDHFNAGIILLNNQLLKQDETLVDRMLKVGQRKGIRDADQTVLNEFFNHQYVPLGLQYNYVVGYDRDVSLAPGNAPGYFEKMANCPAPKIIHYGSPDKPWNLASAGRMRNRWWQYHDLNWSTIINHGELPLARYQSKASFLTLTDSDAMVHLAELAQALPEYEFHIAAFSMVSPTLLHYLRFHNVHVYPSISRPRFDELMEQCSAYMDINYGTKFVDLIEKFAQNGRPVYSFASTHAELNNEIHQTIIEDDDYQTMIDQLKNFK